jgi:hypothetical protein
MANPARIQKMIQMTIAKQVRRLQGRGKKGCLKPADVQALGLYSKTIEGIRKVQADLAQEKWEDLDVRDLDSLVKEWLIKNPAKLATFLKEIDYDGTRDIGK